MKENLRWITGKLWLFLAALIAFIVLYGRIPAEALKESSQGYPAFTQHFGCLWLLLFTIGGIVMIEPDKLRKQDWRVALSLGVISACITMPLQLSGVLNAVAVFCTYLAIRSFVGKEGYPILVQSEKKEWLQNVGIVAVCLVVLLLLRYLTLSSSGNSVTWHWDLTGICGEIAAGISEELLFRLFLFAVVTKLAGEEPPLVVSTLIMILPFALIHAIEPMVYGNISMVIQTTISPAVYALLFVFLIRKRDCATAMMVHAVYDIVMTLLR